MRLATIRMRLVGVALGLLAPVAGATMVYPVPALAQDQVQTQVRDELSTEELSRKPKNKVEPVYPDLARRMNIAGTVKLEVVVAPNGSVKSSRAVGGHPILVNAAMDAMKKWKFEAAPTESSGIVEFRFRPLN